MKILVVGAFLILAIVQWFVPLNMIYSNEKVLRNGKLFRFHTQPIDPSSPFIGRYVWLNFEASRFTLISKDSFSGGDLIYVLLANDSAGFVKVTGISKSIPSKTPDFVEAICNYATRYHDTLSVNVEFPFTKFYMDEYKAPKAERAYQEASQDSAQEAFALVAVFNGKATVKDVMINNRSLREIVSKTR